MEELRFGSLKETMQEEVLSIIDSSVIYDDFPSDLKHSTLPSFKEPLSASVCLKQF